MVTIKFNNWDKYNKRAKDIKNPYWFSMSNNFFYDPEFYDFTPEEKCTFFYMLAEASRGGNYGECSIAETHYARITGLKSIVFNSTLSKLLILKVAAVSRQDGGRMAAGILPLQDSTVQNKTEQNTIASSDDSLSAKEILFPEVYQGVHGILYDRGVSKKLVQSWLATFPDPHWVTCEINKALSWEFANEKRKKKDFGRFITNWMTRGWDKRSTATPTGIQNPNAKMTFDMATGVWTSK